MYLQLKWVFSRFLLTALHHFFTHSVIPITSHAGRSKIKSNSWVLTLPIMECEASQDTVLEMHRCGSITDSLFYRSLWICWRIWSILYILLCMLSLPFWQQNMPRSENYAVIVYMLFWLLLSFTQIFLNYSMPSQETGVCM